ncbi:MAG: flagellar biosynthetic protein FliR [Phycisphaerales bacterium]|nr:MAG: flagellar biosynthetic protein FliR [Phycisphaerales bacterium]
MPWPLLDILLALPAYALVLFRISGLMLTAPVYGSRLIPVRIRAALTLTVAAVVFPLVRSQAPAEMTLSMALVGGVREMMIGAIIGLAMGVLLMGAEVAGLIVGRQAGLALANVYDPNANQQATIVGQVYTISFTLLFLLVGGHRATMAAVLDTFDVIPLLSFRFEESFVLLLVEMLAAAFILGIRLAGPVLLALFMLGTALAFLSRTMPQLNILTVGFTVRLLAAVAVAALALSACQDVLLDAVWDGVELVRATFGLDPGDTRLVS